MKQFLTEIYFPAEQFKFYFEFCPGTVERKSPYYKSIIISHKNWLDASHTYVRKRNQNNWKRNLQ